MQEYDNYIFDLYGTLLDIETDEQQMDLWNFMAQIYNCYGCEWRGEDLNQAYQQMVREEEDLLRKNTGYRYPEIRLERVFARLLFEGTVHHSSEALIAGKKTDQLREDYADLKEAVLEVIMRSDWMFLLANQFRIYSRKRLGVYSNTITVLDRLRAAGKKIYLLSNAQRMFTLPELETTGIVHYFDAIYISSDAGVKKPQPEYMKKLLKEQGIRPEDSVMVGNEMQSDIAVALSCGVDSIYVNTFSLSDIEMERQLWEVFGKAGLTEQGIKKNPVLIRSGDIGELLFL